MISLTDDTVHKHCRIMKMLSKLTYHREMRQAAAATKEGFTWTSLYSSRASSKKYFAMECWRDEAYNIHTYIHSQKLIIIHSLIFYIILHRISNQKKWISFLTHNSEGPQWNPENKL